MNKIQTSKTLRAALSLALLALAMLSVSAAESTINHRLMFFEYGKGPNRLLELDAGGKILPSGPYPRSRPFALPSPGFSLELFEKSAPGTDRCGISEGSVALTLNECDRRRVALFRTGHLTG